MEELTAQLIEEVSLMTSDKRRKKPREVPRPTDERPPATAEEVRDSYSQKGNGQRRIVRGHRAMLQVFAERQGVELGATP